MLKIIQPSHWRRPKGYSNGVIVDGKLVYLAGQIGWNEEEIFEHMDFKGQFEQILKNITTLLKEVQAKPEHIARMTWYVTDMSLYRRTAKEIGPIYRTFMGKHFPAMSVIGVSELVEKQALLEIEVTAVLP